MADSEGKNYYWKSLDQNTTGENVGVVLDSLCDIVAENEIEENQDVVKWIPGEEGQKGHFELGEGGEKVQIPGNDNQIVVANGQEKAKANTGGFYASGSNNISKMDFGYSELELKSLTEYAPDTYWELDKNEAKIHLKGNPLLQMINLDNGGPIISMLGRGIIDFKGDHNSFGDCTNYTQAQRKQSSQPTWMSENAYKVYSTTLSPFSDKYMNEEDTIYPLFSLKHCATIKATDTALAQFTGGSSLIVGGNADVVIRGADDMYYPSVKYGRTRVNIEPGSHFIMQMSNSQQYPTAPFFLMESYEGGGQILLSTALKATTGKWTNFREKDEDFNGIKFFKGWHTNPLIRLNSTNIFGNGRKVWFSGIYAKEFHSYMADYKNTTCVLQGNTNLVIGDSGHIGMRIGPDSGGDILVDWTPEANTATNIKFGGKRGSASQYTIAPDVNAVHFVKFSTYQSGATIFNVVPHGSTSFQFSPENIFGMTVTPSSTNIMCQWKHLTGIFEGQDVFIQIEDNIHKEMLNNSALIQKGYSDSPINDSDTTIDINKGREVHLTDFYIPSSYTDFENYYNSNDNNKTIFHSAIMHIDSLSESLIPDQYTNYYVKKTGGTKAMYKTRFNLGSYAYIDMIISYASDTLYTKEENFRASAYYGAFAATYEMTSTIRSIKSSKLLGYYNGKYYYQAVLHIHLENFFCYTFNQYDIGTAYSKLHNEDKDIIIRQLHIKDCDFDLYQTGSVTVIQSDPIQVSNPEYEITTSIQHLGEDWSRPIQQDGESRSANGSIIQTYDASNFLMRSNLPKASHSGVNIDVANDYTGYTNKRQLVAAFKNSVDYDTFLNSITFSNGHELWDIYDIIVNTSTTVTVLYTDKKVGWDAHLKSVADNPVLELTGQSELRLYDDIYIKGEVEYGTPVYTFGDSKHPEDQVSFTLDELKYLKRFIGTLPSRIANNDSEATEPNTLYFIPGE